MFGDCFGGIGRHARDGDLQRLSRFEIDMIETGASQGNQSRALAVKRGEYVLIESVVDEGADRTRSRRQRHRLLRRSEEHTSELPVTNAHLVCRLLLDKKKTTTN